MKKSLVNIEEVKRLTAKYRDVVGEKVLLEEQDANVARLQKAFNRADFGCQEAGVQEILNTLIVMTGAKGKVNRKNKSDNCEIGVMVVLESETNDHDYDLNKPVLIVDLDEDGDGTGLKMSGEEGNYIPFEDDDLQWRYATDEEIDEYFQEDK